MDVVTGGGEPCPHHCRRCVPHRRIDPPAERREVRDLCDMVAVLKTLVDVVHGPLYRSKLAGSAVGEEGSADVAGVQR